jgi:hypothetical protein
MLYYTILNNDSSPR